MSNLVKSFSLICNEDKRIIDSNEAVTVKLEEMRKIMTENKSESEGFTLGLNPQNVEELLEDDEQQRIIGETQKNTTDSDEIKESAENVLAEAQAKSNELIEIAYADAKHIVDAAMKEAQNIKTKAYSEGLEAGKSEGRDMVNAEKERISREYESLRVQLEDEYREKIKQIEPELADVMLEVFSSVTKVLSADQKDMILALVDKVLSGTESNKNYIIKASREDAEFLRENRENILKSVNRDISIEIVEDASMRKNECIIDTDMGIYDCSLDIQLENLMKAIKILSCTAEK